MQSEAGPAPTLIFVSVLAVAEHCNYDRWHTDFSPSDRAIDVSRDQAGDDHAFLLHLRRIISHMDALPAMTIVTGIYRQSAAWLRECNRVACPRR